MAKCRLEYYWWTHPSLSAFEQGMVAGTYFRRTNRYEFRSWKPRHLHVIGIDCGMTVNGIYRLFGICQVGYFPKCKTVDFDQLGIEMWTTDMPPLGAIGSHWELSPTKAK